MGLASLLECPLSLATRPRKLLLIWSLGDYHSRSERSGRSKRKEFVEVVMSKKITTKKSFENYKKLIFEIFFAFFMFSQILFNYCPIRTISGMPIPHRNAFQMHAPVTRHSSTKTWRILAIFFCLSPPPATPLMHVYFVFQNSVSIDRYIDY